ncbi:deoxynucleoside triphosphate triphosphohydrolase SAMHD1-like [Ruditapes philippinarum]|uniref:deoxynucleoside triphosphate triphosphohydrolase SAMHD1-like n=1 Tax=Ruditapes philippinarum TaxID=129788 RepID=UPI00295A8034|nr:deoxynucleoside triphosphate triphosphohydrolase SAMHD1-like [Ruditapes philippinarum]
MFYTRMTLHRRAYQHKTHKIIGMMICDALELADAHFTIHGKRISETVDDMEAYTYLNDDVIQLIINDNDPRLEASRKILQDIMYRRLFKCVTHTHCKVFYLPIFISSIQIICVFIDRLLSMTNTTIFSDTDVLHIDCKVFEKSIS